MRGPGPGLPRVYILQRYVFTELAKVFVVAFLVAALVLTMGGTLKYLEREQAGLGMLLRVMPLIVAKVLPFIFPVAILLATTMVYGRMSADNEIVALRAAGVHLWFIVAPALLLGLLASGVSLYLADWYIPGSRVRIRQMLARHVAEWLDRRLAQTPIRLGRVGIRHHGKHGSVLKAITITEYGEQGQPELFISAEEASYYVDQEQGVVIFTLRNGSSTGWSAEKESEQLPGKFDEWHHRLELSWLEDSKPDIKDMTTPALWAYRNTLQGDARRDAEAEAYRRGALGVACFVFVFVGVPLGIRTRSGHLLSAFALACLPVYVLYFPLLIIGKSVAEAGVVPTAPALWLPNVVVMVLGGVLLAVEFRR